MSFHKEKLISGFGGAVAIFGVLGLTRFYEQELQVHLLLIASMGATAVLLFAAPHSPLSQPWNVIGGHVASALIGVFIYQQISNPVIGGALAVGMAITAMYYLRCLHPPGGATALIPFIGGAVADSYGFAFALFPVGFGAVLIVMIAVIFNYPFAWRRYPLGLAVKPKTRAIAKDQTTAYPDITHADFVAALSEIDTFVDISEQDLLRIYEIASRRPHPGVEKSRPKKGS